LLFNLNLRPLASRLLAGAQDVGVLVSALPDLFDPRQCASVVATMARWFPKENAIERLERLERDPDIVLRAGEQDQPLDPAFSLGFDADGYEMFAVPGVDQGKARATMQGGAVQRCRLIPGLHS